MRRYLGHSEYDPHEIPGTEQIVKLGGRGRQFLLNLVDNLHTDIHQKA